MKPLVCLLALGALHAQTRETPPPGFAAKPFNVPVRETYTLKNGMKVSLVPYGTVPLVTVRAIATFGNLNETDKQVWLADLMAALMKEGAGKRTGPQLAEAAAGMGGQLNVSAGLDATTVSVNALGDFASDAVKLVAEVWQHPTFPASELERNRANLLRRVVVARSSPQALASEEYARLIYGEHPYARYYPSETQLKGYSLEDVRKFYAANAGARRTHLYIVGRFDPSIRKAIAEAWQDWTEGPAVARNIPKVEAKRRFSLIDRPGAEQSTLRVGLPIAAQPSHPDYLAMQVTDALLGGSFGSRITANIREQKGYTYSPFSQVQVHYHTALWTEQADVTTKVTAESLKEIFAEIERLRKEPPADEELQGIQNYLGGLYVLQNSSPGGIAAQFGFVDQQELTDAYIRTYVQKVHAVTRSDVQRMAEQYLNPAHMSIVVVGDKAKVEEGLKPYH